MADLQRPKNHLRELTERERRIIETKKKVNAQIAAEKREKEWRELLSWYQGIDLEESFEAQRQVRAQKEMQALRRQAAIESSITETEQS